MGHPVLRTRARIVDPAQIRSPSFQRLIDDMFETMREYQGVGLAAPQVHESVRIFVATLDVDDPETAAEPVVLINPEITPVGTEIVEGWEGCLSIPDIRGRVPRAKEIAVRAFDRSGD